MKKLVLYSVWITSIVLSCSKRDDTPQLPEEVIITASDDISSKWKVIDWYDSTARDINGDGQASTDLFSQWRGCLKTSILELLNDGNTVIHYTGPEENPDCHVLQPGELVLLVPWQYERVPPTFSLAYDDYLESYPVIELNSHFLVIQGSWILTRLNNRNLHSFHGGFLRFQRVD